MAQSQRSSFIVMGGFLSLLALSASPILAAETSPTITLPRTALSSLTCPVPAPPPANRDALWNLVGCCMQSQASDSHCRVYSTQYKYIVAKDASVNKTEAYLIIPTIKMVGIESPLTLNSPTLDIWQDAWAEATSKYPGKADSKTGLAINSANSRDQDQLHIHMACVKPAVLTALRQKTISVNPKSPTKLQLPPNNFEYDAVLLTSLSGDSSPFKIVRQLPHVSDKNIQEQSVAVVQGPRPKTYIFLNTYAHDKDKGEAEELLDQTCSQ